MGPLIPSPASFFDDSKLFREKAGWFFLGDSAWFFLFFVDLGDPPRFEIIDLEPDIPADEGHKGLDDGPLSLAFKERFFGG